MTFNILIKKKKKRKKLKGPVLLLEVESVGCKCSGHIQGVSKYSLMRGGGGHRFLVHSGDTDPFGVHLKFCPPSTENKN